MKKTNNKGFTLSELLIVIAIIAVLIAIAIPTFAGSLYNARLQTDHANIRSAHAMAMVATMDGYIDVGGSTIKANEGTVYIFQKDGTLLPDGSSANPYYLQVTPKNQATDCSTSIPCQDYAHTKGLRLGIQYFATLEKWTVVFYNN